MGLPLMARDAVSELKMEVQIEKKLADFTLDVAFRASQAPLSILGASGAGKTMLLRCIAGIENPGRGRIVLNDRVLFDSEKRIAIPARERRIGMLFQNYALFPHRTVAENLEFGSQDDDRTKRDAAVASLVERMHLGGLEARYPRELSGGEQQRVALGRALATEPGALLLDEPLAALDTHLRSQVERQLQDTFAAFRRPTLLVTHNIEEAYRLGEDLLVLARGKVVAWGPKEEIFRRPPSAEVARLTGCKNISRAKMNSDGSVDALDWGCRVRVAGAISKTPKYVGIRAHHIDFVEATVAGASGENVFPCRLSQSSETPFRITLFLTLDSRADSANQEPLQAEVSKEKWQRFRDLPLPWQVRLAPESLFLMSE
jgi:molybdate transport system ATP-binding protein/molybdate transport system permease protein